MLKTRIRRRLILTAVVYLAAASPANNSFASKFNSPPPAESEPPVAVSFYKSLVRSISSTSGQLRLELRPGDGRTHIDGTPDILWFVPNNTVGRARFSYVDGTWRRLRIDFEGDPVSVVLRSGTASEKRVEFSAVTFRANGEGLDYFDRGGFPISIALSTYPELRAHLRISDPNALFVGPIFEGQRSQAVAAGVGLSVRKVLLVLTPERDRMLKINLQRGGVLSFGNTEPDITGCSNSSITLLDDAKITFNTLDYDPGAPAIDSIISPAEFPASNICLSAGNTVLRIGPQGRINFTSLRLLATPTEAANSSVTAFDGILKGPLQEPTVLTLSKDPDSEFRLRAGTGSKISEFKSVQLEVTKHSTMLQIGSGSTLQIKSGKGQMPFGANSLLQLEKMEMSATLAGAWKTGAIPVLIGLIEDFKSDITSGRLTLNPSVVFSVGLGKLEARSLTLSSVVEPFITGSFRNLEFGINEDSNLNLPYRKTVTPSAGAKFKGNDAIAPMTLARDRQYAIGKAALEIPFSRLAYADAPAVQLANGSLKTSLLVAQDNTLVWGDTPAITGTQIGSYDAAEGIAADEYRVISRFPSGKVRSVQADNRVMIINGVPAQTATVITFYDTGRISSAHLARDTVVAGVPLRGNTEVSLYRTEIRVRSGTLATPFTVEGQTYPAGATITIPWIKLVTTKLLTPSEFDPILSRIQTLVSARLEDALYRQSNPAPTCLWGNLDRARGDVQKVLLPIRTVEHAVTYPYRWEIAGMLKNSPPLNGCNCVNQVAVSVTFNIVDKAVQVAPIPISESDIEYRCATCSWYNFGSHHEYAISIWRSILIDDLGKQSDRPLVGSLDSDITQRANQWVASSSGEYVDAEPGSFFMKDVWIECNAVFMKFGYQVQ